MATIGRRAIAPGTINRLLQLATHTDFLPAVCQIHCSAELRNSNRTSIARFGRKSYLRTYPVSLVQTDGSTITIQYKEPRRILTMPVDLTTLSEEERKERQRKREQSRKTVARAVKEDFGDDFNADEYSQFWKKK
ncbi:large ribosomal subunit protein mL55 [Pelodytes ibericus]